MCFFVVGPTFITIPVDINLLVNNNVVLNCSAFANPSATVRWYKDDTQIQTFSNSRFFISSDGTQLTISDLREEDAGVYTCMAKNYVNNITVSSSLTVIGVWNVMFIDNIVDCVSTPILQCLL